MLSTNSDYSPYGLSTHIHRLVRQLELLVSNELATSAYTLD